MIKIIFFIVVISIVSSGCNVTNSSIKGPHVTNAVFNDLAKVKSYTDKKNYGDALNFLNKIQKNRSESLNDYEKAQIFNYYGYIYFTIGEKDKAVNYYEKIVDEAVLDKEMIPDSLRESILRALIGFYFQAKEYSESIEIFDKYIKYGYPLMAKDHILLANTHALLGNKKASLEQLDFAEIKSMKSGTIPIDTIKTFRSYIIKNQADKMHSMIDVKTP